jgi:hypothetical protein
MEGYKLIDKLECGKIETFLSPGFFINLLLWVIFMMLPTLFSYFNYEYFFIIENLIYLFVFYFIIHEFIHWFILLITTKNIGALGFSEFRPCIYSYEKKTLVHAIIIAIAPFIILHIINILLFFYVIIYDFNIINIFYSVFFLVINFSASFDDFKMIKKYLLFINSEVMIVPENNFNCLYIKL